MDPLSSIPKIDDEPDVYGKAWEAWKLDQTPKGNAALLGTVKPLIDRGVMSYAPNNELAKAHAKVLTIHAARTYDPTKSKLNTGRVEREDADETSSSPAVHKLGIPGAQEYWLKIVYDDLQPVDQRVMELTLGLNGQSKLSNQEIAARLRISPGAVTQRKAKIQAVLDREHDLSPFSE